MKILIDSREQKPYHFPNFDTTTTGLTTGDYSVDGFEDVFSVERKSINDLANSLGNNRDRFEREVIRAQELQEFAVVIEATPTQISAGAYYSSIHPNSIFGTIGYGHFDNGWDQKYATLDWYWTEDREGGRQKTIELLREWNRRYGQDLA